jgi:hypothetical protein
MKKLVFLMSLILVTGLTFGQTFQKGNLVGAHIITVTLQPGVTMEKFIEFYKTKVIPEEEKNFPGMKMYLIKSLRGENKDSFGGLVVFKTEADRDKYWAGEGVYTNLGKKADEKCKPVMDELNKLGTMSSKYNDWLVL